MHKNGKKCYIMVDIFARPAVPGPCPARAGHGPDKIGRPACPARAGPVPGTGPARGPGKLTSARARYIPS